MEFLFLQKKNFKRWSLAQFTRHYFLGTLFFLNAITHKKSFSLVCFCVCFLVISVLFPYKMLADIFLCLTVCLSLLSECLSYFLTYRVFLSLFLMLFSPFSFNLTACALLTWVKSICFWLYGRFPHQNDSEFFSCLKCQSYVD
jgi:hypothetical protein